MFPGRLGGKIQGPQTKFLVDCAQKDTLQARTGGTAQRLICFAEDPWAYPSVDPQSYSLADNAAPTHFTYTCSSVVSTNKGTAGTCLMVLTSPLLHLQDLQRPPVPRQLPTSATTTSAVELIPTGSDGKESACNAGVLGSIPRPGRPRGEENGNPLQYSCLENSTERGSRWAGPWGCKEQLTEQLTLSLPSFRNRICPHVEQVESPGELMPQGQLVRSINSC